MVDASQSHILVLSYSIVKKFLVASIGVVGLLLAVLVYERLFIEETFGPAAIAVLSTLALLFIMLLGSLLLYGTRHRRTVGNLWLAIFSFALTYVAVDLVAGHFLIKPLSPPLVPDKYRHHKLVPNSNAQFTQREFSYVQRVNNLGMRGVDRTIEKPKDTFRVLMLGDSYTMGKGVQDNETSSVLLEHMLNEQLGACSGVAFEVLNAGVDSYAPILSYVQLTRDLAKLDPDLVFLNLDINDLVQESAYRTLATYSPDGTLIGVPQSDPKSMSLTARVRNWVEGHLYLTRWALYYINRLGGYRDLTVREVVTQANFEVAAHTLFGDPVNRDAQWLGLFDSINKIKRFVEHISATFILTIYPWPHQVNDTEWIPGRYLFVPKGAKLSERSVERIQEMSKEFGIVLLNQYPRFRAYRGENKLYYSYDGHFTPAGHRLMAQGIFEFISKDLETKLCGESRLLHGPLLPD